MAYLVGDCGSRQALENEDDDCNLNRKRCHVSSHHHRWDAEPEAAPTTWVQEGAWGLRSSSSMMRWSTTASASRTGKRSRHEQQGVSGLGPEAGDDAGAGKKWTLEARNLIARICTKGISVVE
jgi:hypothetical protein